MGTRWLRPVKPFWLWCRPEADRETPTLRRAVIAFAFQGDVTMAVVLPVIGLSWLQRGLKHRAQRGTDGPLARPNDSTGDAR